MKCFISILTCAGLVTAFPTRFHDIEQLTPETYKDFIQSSPNVLVNYQSTRSLESYAFLRTYRSIGDFFLKAGDTFRVAAVDCHVYPSFCEEQLVTTWPTLRLHRQDPRLYVQFDGRRTADEIVNFVSGGRHSLPPTVTHTPTSSPTAASHVHANAAYGYDAVSISDSGRQALVKLALPGVPMLREPPFTLETSSAVALNFTISTCGHHLLLGGQPIGLQGSNASSPTSHTAAHVPLAWSFANRIPQHARAGIDYEISIVKEDDSIDNPLEFIYDINLIGISVQHSENAITEILLDSIAQRVIRIRLKREYLATKSPMPRLEYRLMDIEFRDRGLEGSYVVPHPDDIHCNLLSWRCAELDTSPWYRHFWRIHFDEYGRKGSLRRALVKTGHDIQFSMMPYWRWVMLLAIVILLKAANPIARRQEKVDTQGQVMEKE